MRLSEDVNWMIIRLSLMTVLSAPALATPTPSADSYKIDSLFAVSDAVCAGTIRITSDQPAPDRSPIPAAILVISREVQFTTSRCYKGAVSAQATGSDIRSIPRRSSRSHRPREGRFYCF